MVEAKLAEPDARRPLVGSLVGLTDDEAQRRLTEVGPNSVREALPPHWRIYLAKFWSPIAWLLEAAMLAEIVLGKDVEAAVIAGLLLLNATLAFMQERRADAALQALKKRLALTTLACRDGKWIRLRHRRLCRATPSCYRSERSFRRMRAWYPDR